ncbi:AAA family ATPase [Dyella sp.]|uniref:AAA family ATPase n=1 Tax=Dyella sp. TaxID=1869338 RepID=UPI002ED4388F
MLSTLAVAGYRSLRALEMPLGRLNVITGSNGAGKSNLYRALRLLAETAQGGVVSALAREGGLSSTLWAGPEEISKAMRRGDVEVEGGPRRDPIALKLGFADDDFGYAIDLGLPQRLSSMFSGDPQIKREVIWSGPFLRNKSNLLVDRSSSVVSVRDGRSWRVVHQHLSQYESMFTQIADPVGAPEVLALRERIRGWRFYDHFRTDVDAPARASQIGTRTPVLSHDGRDLAAAWRTIQEMSDGRALEAAVEDAFPGARVDIVAPDGRFELRLSQHGLLRPLSVAELSDGTLRYLLWIAALHTPRPPPMMILNEPETSLHPDLLLPLARLIIKASERTQVWVVSHASRLISALTEAEDCNAVHLEKSLGETRIRGHGLLDGPPWHWPER